MQSVHLSATFKWVQVIERNVGAFGTDVDVGCPRRALAASHINFMITFTFSHTQLASLSIAITFTHGFCTGEFFGRVDVGRPRRALAASFTNFSPLSLFLSHTIVTTFIFYCNVPTLLESLGRCWRWPPSSGTGSLAAVVCNRGPRAYDAAATAAPKMLMSYAPL